VNPGEQQNGVKPGTVEPNTPEAAAMPKSALKPTAPEFKPLSRVMYGLAFPELLRKLTIPQSQWRVHAEAGGEQ
jgi:hypothetical protein